MSFQRALTEEERFHLKVCDPFGYGLKLNKTGKEEGQISNIFALSLHPDPLRSEESQTSASIPMHHDFPTIMDTTLSNRGPK